MHTAVRDVEYHLDKFRTSEFRAAKDFIKKIVTKEVDKRLGSDGFDEVFDHEFVKTPDLDGFREALKGDIKDKENFETKLYAELVKFR